MAGEYLKHAFLILSGELNERTKSYSSIWPEDISIEGNRVTLFKNRNGEHSVEFYGDGINPPTSVIYKRENLVNLKRKAKTISKVYHRPSDLPETETRFDEEKGSLEVKFEIENERNLSFIKRSIDSFESFLG